LCLVAKKKKKKKKPTEKCKRYLLSWGILLKAAAPMRLISFLNHRGGYYRQIYTGKSSNTSNLHFVLYSVFQTGTEKTEYMDYSLLLDTRGSTIDIFQEDRVMEYGLLSKISQTLRNQLHYSDLRVISFCF
jgi:hypothetical protein